MAKSKKRDCPFCLEKIVQEAKKCKACGEYLRRIDRFLHNLCIPLIIGILVGVLVYHSGRIVERREQERVRCIEEEKQNNKTIMHLKGELSDNFANLNNIEGLLRMDLKLLGQNKMIITPLCPFTFEVWERAKFGNANFLIEADTKDFMKLTHFYVILRIIDAQVRDREVYRLLNEGKQGFAKRMETLDTRILKNIETIKPILKQSQEYLDEIHQWKVKGESFYIDEGFVVEIRSEDGSKDQPESESL